MRRISGLLALAVASALTLAACGSDDGGDDAGAGPIKLKVGYPAAIAQYADLFVCKDEGIFAKHGLDVDLTLLNTSSQLIAALTSGTVQVGGGDGVAIAAGALKGADLKFTQLNLPVYFTELWTEPDITTVDDLKGKKVGVTAPGSVTDRSMRLMLDDKGLSDDVDVVNFSSLSALIAAGKNDSVDALLTGPPQGALTKEEGWHKVTDLTNYQAAAEVYSVTGSYAADHKEALDDFAAADVECLQFLRDPANREASVDAIAKYTATDDRALAEYAYDFFVKIWAYQPVVDENLVHDAFTRAAADDGSSVPDDVSKFIDDSFIEKAVAK